MSKTRFSAAVFGEGCPYLSWPSVANMKLPQDLVDHVDDAIDLFVGHSGKEWQCDGTGEVPVGDREIVGPGGIAFPPVGHLVQGPIVDRRANPGRGQCLDEIIACGSCRPGTRIGNKCQE